MKKAKLKISVIIVAKNEEVKLSECLESVKWATEIVVIDNYSTDKTVEIAKRFGAIVYKIHEGDFSTRKNFGFSKASCDWILSLDADERATTSLRQELNQLINKQSLAKSRFGKSINQFSAYAIPRKNIILGKEFKYGGQWPDYVIRLFKKDKFVRWTSELHEQPEIDGKLAYLKSPLIHHKHDNLSEMVEKTNMWSEVEAKLMHAANHPPMNLIRFFTALFREFYLRMIKQKSFMDGGEGVIYALYQVFSRFLSYAKLWEMQLQNKNLKFKI